LKKIKVSTASKTSNMQLEAGVARGLVFDNGEAGRLGINSIGPAIDALNHLRQPCKERLSREAVPTRHA